MTSARRPGRPSGPHTRRSARAPGRSPPRNGTAWASRRAGPSAGSPDWPGSPSSSSVSAGTGAGWPYRSDSVADPVNQVMITLVSVTVTTSRSRASRAWAAVGKRRAYGTHNQCRGDHVSGAASRRARARRLHPRVTSPATEVDDGVRDPVEAAGGLVFARDARQVAAEVTARGRLRRGLGLPVIVKEPCLPERDLQRYVPDRERLQATVCADACRMDPAAMAAETGDAHVSRCAPGSRGRRGQGASGRWDRAQAG